MNANRVHPLILLPLVLGIALALLVLGFIERSPDSVAIKDASCTEIYVMEQHYLALLNFLSEEATGAQEPKKAVVFEELRDARLKARVWLEHAEHCREVVDA